MNDRYLFRAKRIDNGEWVEGNIILSKDADEEYKAIIIPSVNSNMFTEDSGNEDLGFENWYKVDQSTICQCTGMKDKNGKLIWENDIVKYDWGGTRIDSVEYQPPIFTYSKSMRWNLQQDEVIGNIFDNPELLESGE